MNIHGTLQAEGEKVIGMLDSQESEIRVKLETSNRDFHTLIGGPVGHLMPPPPSSNNSATVGSESSTPSTVSSRCTSRFATSRVEKCCSLRQ